MRGVTTYIWNMLSQYQLVACVLYYFFARSNQLRVSATEKVSVHKRAGPAAARMSMLYIASYIRHMLHGAVGAAFIRCLVVLFADHRMHVACYTSYIQPD
jgi:hypothetical protein